MSDSQAYEAITVGSDGVRVTKRFEADEFPVPAIAFQFGSERSQPVRVRLTDVVPEDVAVEDLGFHPEYGSEFWTIDDDEISFEREIEPDADYTTVYGIRATGTDNVEQFLTEPELAMVDPPIQDDASDVVGEGSEAVKEAISGESDSVPGVDEADEDVATLDLNDPENQGSGGAAGGAGAAAGYDSVVAAMADEIRNNEASKEDVELLKKAFDLASEDGSTEARIEKLQSDVDEVLAYTDALEEFLDENGTARKVLSEYQDDIDQFRSEIEGFESDLTMATETAAANGDRLDDVQSRLSELDARIEGLREDVESVRDAVGDGDVEQRIDEVDREIEALKEWREQLSSVIGGGEE